MSDIIAKDHCSLIVGAGATGISIARHLLARGEFCIAYDTRAERAVMQDMIALLGEDRCFNYTLPEAQRQEITRVCLSPGVALSDPVVQWARQKHIPVVGDIALFLQAARAPVVGITGSNGKSTVTTLLGDVAKKAGLRTAVGGNLGQPALSLLDDAIELYVLEISSFQLESTENPKLKVAVNLNLSADHLDRHGSMANYFAIKQKIFHGAQHVVYKLHDALTQPPLVASVKRYGFGIAPKIEKREIQFHLDAGHQNLQREEHSVFSRAAVRQKGLHNLENVLAVLACAEALNIDFSHVASVVAEFTGLPHRCQWVAELGGVTFINDSKATNVGACAAALSGLKADFKHIVLIAGGLAKGADFTELAAHIIESVSSLVLIGRDGPQLHAAVADKIPCFFASDMRDAVVIARAQASAGDLVLLSPACASMDMFRNFEERGDVFRACVEELAA